MSTVWKTYELFKLPTTAAARPQGHGDHRYYEDSCLCGVYPSRARLSTSEGQLKFLLVDELGFDGVDAGGLDDSWRQQPGTPVYDKDPDSTAVRRALAEAQKERLPQWRATANSPGRFAQPA